MSSHDDDEDLSRQATVLANAEELSREHSQRRAVKLREERVRPLGGGGPKRREESARSRTKDAGNDREESVTRKVKEDSGRRRGPGRPRARPKGVEDPLRANVSESSSSKGAPDDSNPRLSDPFPPIRKKGKPSSSSASNPAAPAARSAEARTPPARKAPTEADLPSRNPSHRVHSGPYRTIGTGASGSDLLAMELEELLRRFRGGWKALGGGDKIAVLSSLMVLAGTLMPWVSLPGRPLQVGLLSGGLVHVALAVAVMRFVVQGFANEFEFSAAELGRRRARHSLYIVLLGALSTAFGAYLLLMWGAQKAPEHPISFHFGLYWTLACGTGVSYGGFARFGTGGPR
jgi:hypothetical protein